MSPNDTPVSAPAGPGASSLSHETVVEMLSTLSDEATHPFTLRSLRENDAALRSTAPTYVYRGHCEDCDGPAVLIDGLACDVCGSRSVVLISKGWVGKKKPDWRDEVAA